MPRKSTVQKTIEIGKNKFKLEIYLGLETEFAWEIFPHDYNAALYAFSHKNRLTKIIENKYIYEVRK
tara:strand:+ start:243 stop:443 length:201 start_codon:yes stop_codon:yes gene_type:complete